MTHTVEHAAIIGIWKELQCNLIEIYIMSFNFNPEQKGSSGLLTVSLS